MGDPVFSTVVGVGAALTKMFLRACDAAFAADLVGDGQELLGTLLRALHRTDGSRGQIERRISQTLANRIQAMQERCGSQSVDPGLLSGVCTEVEIILDEITYDDGLLLSAVRSPESFPEKLRDYAAGRRTNVESAAEPYFDELIEAVATQYAAFAPWSHRFQIEAFKSVLSGIDEIQDKSRRSLQAHEMTHEMLNTVLSNLAEVTRHEDKPTRILFGSRPDVATGGRFVARVEQDQLNELITDTTKQRTVLVGMRGCGKTQLAAALAKQCEDANWSLVAWVNAVSPESIKSALVELAKQLQIDTSDLDNRDQIVRRCLDHLKSARPTNRLIVFDNIENINHLRGLMPNGDGLRVVATTTNNTGWEHQDWKIIKVGVFDRSDSINYLLTITTSNDQNAADALAERLGDLPLAVAQAAATARLKELSLPRYLKRLESHRKEHTICPVPGDDYTDDVATALCMAIEDALENLADPTRRYARRQLGALALLAESGVPTRWLDPTVEQQENLELQGNHQTEDEYAHDALTELIHRSIVQQSTDIATTVLHRLQAQAFRESWDENETAEAYESAAILLDKVNVDRFPRNDTDSRRQETLDLIEQLRAISEQEHSRNIFTYANMAVSLFQALSNAHDLALYSEALTLEASVDTIQDILGSEHPDTLTVLNNFGITCLDMQLNNQAIAIFERLLSVDRRLLDENDSTVFVAQNNLASAYQKDGRLRDAITLYETALVNQTQIPTAIDPDTLTALCNLAAAYQAEDRSEEASKLFDKVLDEQLHSLGPDHPDTLNTRSHLANTYFTAGLLAETTELYEHLLADSIRVLGETHPDTLTYSDNLAKAYETAGHIDKAISLFEKTLKMRIDIMGRDHPKTIALHDNLAHAYCLVGNFARSIRLYKQLIDDTIQTKGADAPDTLMARNNLAYTYAMAGRSNIAASLFMQVLEDRTRVLGPDHPDTLASRNNLIAPFLTAVRPAQAVELLENLLKDCLRLLGTEHPLTKTVRENLDAARRELERQKEDAATE